MARNFCQNFLVEVAVELENFEAVKLDDDVVAFLGSLNDAARMEPLQDHNYQIRL